MEAAVEVEVPMPAAGKQEGVVGQTQLSARSDDMENWSEARIWAYKVVSAPRFDFAAGVVIVSNMILLLMEANEHAACWPEECQIGAYQWLNRILLVIYTAEAGMRGFAARERYWYDHWNLLDLFVVVTGIVNELIDIAVAGGGWNGMEVLPLLRILRVMRLVRAIGLLRFHPELYHLICGFLSSIKAMSWGFMFIILLLLVWSFVCMEVVHPINKEMWTERREAGKEVDEFCEELFASVFNSVIFFFQTLVVGDEWGRCMLPIVHYNKYTMIIFTMAWVSVTLGFMNLILAVIVDHARAAREADEQEQIREKKKQEVMGLKKWKDVIRQLDVDQSGTISCQELKVGYEQVKEVRDALNAMGIDETDLDAMFHLMDDDGSGDLDYSEFVEEVIKAQKQDLRIYLMMNKLQTDRLARTSKVIHETVRGGSVPSSPRASVRNSQASDFSFGGQANAAAAALDADLQRLNGRIQKQFEALAQSIELEFSTLAQEREAQVWETEQVEYQGGTLAAQCGARSPSAGAAFAPCSPTGSAMTLVGGQLGGMGTVKV